MDLRSRILIKSYELCPFPLRGDARLGDSDPSCDLSCVINFYGRVNLLRVILTGLAAQGYDKNRFEVVLIEDRGGTEEGRSLFREYEGVLKLRYYSLEENFGVMGYARNFGLGKTRGRYILFLDDDTVITDGDFVSKLVREFEAVGAEAVIPRGSASYCLLEGKYSFHDPYYPSNRCMAYRRETLRELCGFVDAIIGQEDVEFTVRLIAARKKLIRSQSVSYMHPPLLTNSTNKAAAVGASFAKLRRRYPFPVWVMLLVNGSRYIPKLIYPFSTKCRMQGKFSLGFALGILYAITGKKLEYN
ncbi:MAG TPA: glycosyltransferase family A protein [Thermodesulfobacteriota bacterium]|nr:glycosyltransferase family A protein [Thermodesulfobacteriota bacterium]